MSSYWVFEGGGAKGISHIGAYAYMRQTQKVTPKGIAGASAGAIVAALIAAGCDWDDLFDPNNKLKPGILNIDNCVREFGFSHMWWLIRWGRFIAKIPRRWFLIWFFAPQMLLWGLLFFLFSSFGKGLFKTEKFESWLDKHLQETFNRRQRRLKHPEISESLKFSDIARAGIPLCLVSTNISRRELVVFDAKAEEENPELTVARAVAASIAIPIFFRPVKIQGSDDLYVDGGVTSNFPVWMFEESRENFGRKTPLIGVQLLAASPGPATGKLLDYLGSLISTAISGAQKIEEQRIKNLNLIQIAPNVGTIEFDMSAGKRDEIYWQGFTAAAALMRKRPQLANPKIVTHMLDLVLHELAKMLNDSCHLRANIILPVSNEQVMVYFTSSSMTTDSDTDDCLIFSRDQGATGRCLTDKRAILADLSLPNNRSPGAYNLDKYQQALVRRSLQSLLCVPILRPKDGLHIDEVESIDQLEAIGTLNIDSDQNLNQTLMSDAFQQKCFKLIADFVNPTLGVI